MSKENSKNGDLIKTYEDLSKPMPIQEYVELLHQDARPARTSAQRVFDMIEAGGFESYKEYGRDAKRPLFFLDVQEDGSYSPDSIFGIDRHLMEVVNYFKAAALGYGQSKRVLLMHGPVGCAKSTIAVQIKKGLEQDSYVNPLFAFRWKDLGDIGVDPGLEVQSARYGKVRVFNHRCQMHEEPLKLVDLVNRAEVVRSINQANLAKRKDLQENGEPFMKYAVNLGKTQLCPHCRFNYQMLMEHYGGDWDKVMEHVLVYRILLSEVDRIGIGTFQPKDEKNQDSTELTGNKDFRKIAMLGSDSDPRAFNFDGELNIANRGVAEFIEILKLERAFLYDLLGASQEKKIKPKKFSLTDVDLVIIGHTNEGEYKRLQDDKLMEALKDRTVRIDIPYNLKKDEEVKIYQKDYNELTVPHHIAPHALEVAAIFAVLSRVEAPEEGKIDRMTKLKLYNGETLPHVDQSVVWKMIRDAKREGLDGISTRFNQDRIAEAIVGHDEECVTPFMLMSGIEGKMKFNVLLDSEEQVAAYIALLGDVKAYLEEKCKDEVQQAITGNPEELSDLFDKYLLNVMAYRKGGKIRDPLNPTRERDPDERLMGSIEQAIGIGESQKDTFREQIVNQIASYKLDNREFRYDSNEELKRALTLKLFNDKKDTVKLESLFTGAMSDETREKIQNVKDRLIEDFSYCDVCASDVLDFVGSIFARGQAGQKD